MSVGGYIEQTFGGRMYPQGLFEESATAKCKVGTLRPLDDGRTFVYAKAGAAALAAGQLVVSSAPVANHKNIAVAATAIGAKRVYVTLGATAATKDQYKDGWLSVNDEVGEGHLYKIRGNPAIDSSGSAYIELYDSIRVALTTASQVTLTAHPQNGVVVHTAATAAIIGAPAGVAPMAITAAYYFWSQVKGPCPVLAYGTIVLGNGVVADATASTGQAGGIVAAADHAAVIKGGIVGVVLQVNASTEYALINLNILGY